jgi:cytochrome c biogenesis protein CcmG, thiol:disulfide interchange protein DsbE
MKRIWLWLPLGLFVAMVAVMAGTLAGKGPAPHVSRLVGKPVPQFSLPAISPDPKQPGLGSATFKQGQPRLLNIFASWCLPCIAEAPHLMTLAKAGVQIDGIALRDRPEDLARFLRRNGNPFRRIGGDQNGQVQLSLGSSGVPESFVIDGRGIIRMHHIGDVREEDVPEILAAIRQAAR